MRDNRASDKELDDVFWKRVAAENKHLDLEDKIANAKKFNLNKLPKPTKEDLSGYRSLCTKFASIKRMIVKKLKYDFDEETIEAILKAYGDRIYFNVMKSQLPSDELAETIVLGILDLLDELT